MARDRKRHAQGKAAAAAPASSVPASSPAPVDRTAWLDVIRALARQAARADHEAEQHAREG